MLLRLCLGTVFVLVLCAGSLFLAKPWLKKLQASGTSGDGLQVEGSVQLGNRAVLYLVKVGDTQLVAGTDATGLKSLIALPASFKEVLDEQVPAAETPALPPNFGLRLHATAEPREGAA
jgi:flagellar biogenesis protein FliO